MTFPKDTTPSIDAETSRNKVVFGVVVDQTGKPRTHAQDRTLLRALRRGEPYHLFPMPLRGDAGDLVRVALIRRGLATDEQAQVLTELGVREARNSVSRGN